MNTIIHRAVSRGKANYGWLDTNYSFSFFRYYDSEKMNFGLLRVLNDDIIQPAKGFDTHPHDNMEIVTIPLEGEIEHKDSTGHIEIIETNDVQIMSAGSGLMHSEFNHSKTREVKLLQIWVLPKKINIEPRYDQKTFPPSLRKNSLQLIVSPDKSDDLLWINQDAYFSRSDLDKGSGLKYDFHKRGNGLYLFLIDGEIKVGTETMKKRDAIGISGTNQILIKAEKDSQLLFIEVPMERSDVKSET
jgi:redox-sensitive bicupin YhaK (pirin superfamily)